MVLLRYYTVHIRLSTISSEWCGKIKVERRSKILEFVQARTRNEKIIPKTQTTNCYS